MASHLPELASWNLLGCSLVALLVAAYSQLVASAARQRAAELEKAQRDTQARTGETQLSGVTRSAVSVEASGSHPVVLDQLVRAIHEERRQVDEALAALAVVVTGPAAAHPDQAPGSGRSR